MKAVVHFSRSPAAGELTGHMEDAKEVIVDLGPDHWTQLTYQYLRFSPDGDFFSTFSNGMWWYDGEPWSDIIINMLMEEQEYSWEPKMEHEEGKHPGLRRNRQ